MARNISLTVVAFALTACSSLNPGVYSDFDAWLVGQPDRDYSVVDLEGRPPWEVMAWSTTSWPIFAARDGLKWAAVPLVYPYFVLVGGSEDESREPRP